MYFIPISQLIQEEKPAEWVHGLSGASRGWFLNKWIKKHKKPILIIAQGAHEAEAFVNDLESFKDNGIEVFYFPEWEDVLKISSSGSMDLIGERWKILEKLDHLDGPVFFVTTIAAILYGVVESSVLKEIRFDLEVGTKLERKKLFKWLLDNGYDRIDCVEEKGEFSHRGGIIDIFPINSEWPVRIELMGDDFESLRIFHPQTQCSLKEGKMPVCIYPAGERDIYKKNQKNLICLNNYFQKGLVVLDEPAELQARVKEIENITQVYISWSDWWKKLEGQHRIFLSLLKLDGDGASVDTKSLSYLNTERKTPDMVKISQDMVFGEISEWIKEEYEIHIFCNNEGEKRRLKELLKERKIIGEIDIKIGRISGGFVLPQEKLVVISDEEIFGRYKVRLPRRNFKGYGVPLKEFTQLKRDDYVVHIDHGIGRYLGVSKEKTGEMMVLQYANKVKLYVPIDEAHLIERYMGIGSKPPKLNQLNGMRWLRTKAKVERILRDMAAELLSIQAAREAAPGIAFSPDNLWQKEMEDSFIYEETPDQLRAVEELKRDMERKQPMDRLLCGDVGYGKTEVALRAAFKAVMDGKQVAVLVPTTLLAQQHYRTFCDRMADYPVVIEMLSRFRSNKEQTGIIKALKEGSIDIIIGTHRLIQSDIKFKDLGMVITDEEQRFGVRHKEYLKKLRSVVDVLTLTATPIPRTLYMSLVGLRDMSVINTPPQDRLAVETIVTGYDEDLIKKVILREVSRQGQVYFLHNRVENIEVVTGKLKWLLPQVRFTMGHGQMDEEELSVVMDDFVAGKADVLVCTTIIQSGIDIPNVNTIIINDAHKFGLADLYQLRGRVGRFKHKAYAYLLLPKNNILTGTAKKRLKAIEDFSHLGAGFKIAMQDLEIRGAGNILGAQQHGYIQAVGFDMYCKLLKKNVLMLKGEVSREIYEVKFDIDVNGYIPESYIPSERIRIDFYKRIACVLDEKELKNIYNELEDRFGSIPTQVEILLKICKIKIQAVKVGVKEIKELRGNIYIVNLNGEKKKEPIPEGTDKLQWIYKRLE